MAKKQGVWGIDIGLCSIKALRCTAGDKPGEVVADKYDLIEFPKMLNQPEVEAEEEIRSALKQFMERNELKGDFIAISVPGQSGLPRFFRPPPVDLKTLPEIVKYEVKQQIPFPIEDVIWDWQRLGGVEVEDRIVDAEVGLFAMKREAVYKALKPFDDAGIEINLIQLSPLAVFNFVTHDVFESIPNAEEFDPDNPPDSTVVMSMGTDTTDLIVTNGIKLWLRNIPVGGNHFTKHLAREMKLTHAKAEHLKRNAKLAEDPKSLFRAMRPVFNDLVNEVQRSLTFFRSIDKHAKLSNIVLVGNSANLPGLRQFLAAQLEMDIAKVTSFKSLSGNEVVGQSTFDENMLTFVPAYGLCLQGLKQGLLKTNLLPPEIQVERIIRAKKPWVLAALSMLMLGLLVGWFLKSLAYDRSTPKFSMDGQTSWEGAFKEVASVKNKSETLMGEDEELAAKLKKVNQLNREIVSESVQKATWLELLQVINQALPVDERIQGDAVDSLAIPFEDRNMIYVQHIASKFEPDLSKYEAELKLPFKNQFESEADAVATTEAGQADGSAAADVTEAATNPLAKPGWIIEIKGHHYHNSEESMNKRDFGRNYVVRHFIQNLIEGIVTLPGAENDVAGGGTFSYEDFGVFMPTIVDEKVDRKHIIPYLPDGVSAANVMSGKGGFSIAGPVAADGTETERIKLDDMTPEERLRHERKQQAIKDGGFKTERYEFTIQLLWIPRSPSERNEARKVRLAAEQAAAAAAPQTNTQEQ